MKNGLKDWLIDIIKERLDDRIGYTSNTAQLAYDLFEGENGDGSFTYNTPEAKEWISEYFESIGEIVKEADTNGLEAPNCFLAPEKFQVFIIIEIAYDMLGTSNFIIENWDKEIEITKEIANKIIEEIKQNCDTYYIYD